ncbi:MAG: carboxymuconolactone decarboxylase family protein [Rhizomicrobium sp.]
MRLRKPRIKPLAEDEATDAQKAIIATFNPIVQNLNLFRTILRFPDAFQGLTAWGNYIQSKKNDLQGRKKEIVILRTSFADKAAYEWSHHHRIGLSSGLSAEEIEAIKRDPDDFPWDLSERILLQAVDELKADTFISNETWTALAKYYSEKQMVDIVLTCSHYSQIGKIVNAFGIQLDAGTRRDEDLIAYEG